MAEPIRPSDPADEQRREVASSVGSQRGEVDEAAAARRDLGDAAPAAAADREETLLPPPAVTPAREPEQQDTTVAREAESPTASARAEEEPVEPRREPTPAASTRAPIEPPAAYRKPIDPPTEYRSPAAAPTGDAPTAAVPVPAGPQPVTPPAAPSAPPPPPRRGNRLAGTAWALLAAGLFQLLYFASLAGLAALLSGPASIGPSLGSIVAAKWGVFTWLPVLFLFLLHELTVLIAGRAGRFFWVVASGIIAVLVYALSTVLILIVVRSTVPDTPTLLQTFLNPTFILIGVVAREVVLWTGFAAGARGVRIRQRDREDRERYDRDLAARTAASS